MASVHRKRGASGLVSPYWNAKLKGPNGSVGTLTTKLREKKLARALARVWEMAAEVARNGRLTHEKAQKFLAECADITRGDGFKKSQEFLDECLRQSTGSGLNSPTTEKYFRDWLIAKEQVGRTSPSTLTRYAPILERFVAFLPDIRRRSPLASITASDIEGFLRAEKNRGLSNATANGGVRVLRIVLNTARRKGVITSNVAEAVDLLVECADYSQPISPDFFPILQELVAHRQSLGQSMLCEIPILVSVEWRRFLDELGLKPRPPRIARYVYNECGVSWNARSCDSAFR